MLSERLTERALLIHLVANGYSFHHVSLVSSVGQPWSVKANIAVRTCSDSANSATALYTGKKSSVDALNVYADSSPSPFDDPKFESIAEMAYRINGAKIGVVSTAL